MRERTRDLVDYTILAVSFALLVLAIVGEIVGWWGDLGIVLMIASLIGTVFAALDIYGRRGVGLLGTVVDNQQAMIHHQETMLATQGSIVETQDGFMRRLDRIQDALDDRLRGYLTEVHEPLHPR